MLFNSIAYAFFLPLIFFLYWIVLKRSKTAQNGLLLVASYVFYGWWDFRFLFLLIFSTLLDYCSGIMIYQARSSLKKRIWLFSSVIINVGFLAVFKYYNFFIESFYDIVQPPGGQVINWTLKIILPVGISFYTFHGLSYVFDIYNRKTVPSRNFIDYSLFVSFFPLLVAGPIERATHLLPQISAKREFDYKSAKDALRQILWGLFKKVVIADNCARIVNEIFKTPEIFKGSTLLYGAVLFAFQIYCDFSGYSDIALGSARLFGIELIRNFNYPYFSRNVAEFWRRWHISLSTWFRDYIYIPLGGSRGSRWQKIRNTLLMFIISGFWHGANWTFLLWGALNGLLFLPLLLTRRNKKHATAIVAENRYLPSWSEVFGLLTTFLSITAGWILFRADTIRLAFSYYKGIFSKSFISQPQLFDNLIFKFILILLIVEWIHRDKTHGLQIDYVKWPAIRWGIYIGLIYLICYFGGTQQGFIYFQF
ncbi:alginate O-acetyltransferase complex protein AlgI [Mucilaginibacter sp. OAE612]